MTEVFKFLIDCMSEFIDKLNSIYFEFFGLTVSLGFFMMSLIVFGFIISVFWKGAKS